MQFKQRLACAVISSLGLGPLVTLSLEAQAQPKQPKIVVIMGDDIGWFNIGAYHQGIMAGKTPNLNLSHYCTHLSNDQHQWQSISLAPIRLAKHWSGDLS